MDSCNMQTISGFGEIVPRLDPHARESADKVACQAECSSVGIQDATDMSEVVLGTRQEQAEPAETPGPADS